MWMPLEHCNVCSCVSASLTFRLDMAAAARKLCPSSTLLESAEQISMRTESPLHHQRSTSRPAHNERAAPARRSRGRAAAAAVVVVISGAATELHRHEPAAEQRLYRAARQQLEAHGERQRCRVGRAKAQPLVEARRVGEREQESARERAAAVPRGVLAQQRGDDGRADAPAARLLAHVDAARRRQRERGRGRDERASMNHTGHSFKWDKK
eukprot:TRINITY_DN4571_c0_g1_i3.p1 TRINITY_DN4571_c0_g1~~TRINITY_DN4571_c0_g1_i3.p1  ORF type:complete len:211 (+),score=35.01 TRINITY_DN4571_c0_g1_i3:200-832(+)